MADREEQGSEADVARPEGRYQDRELFPEETSERTRRDVLTAGAAIGGALIAGAGALHHGVQYVVPHRNVRVREVFVAHADQVPEGGTLEVTLPTGARVQIKNVGGEFAGFSDVCPHLGCKVTWTKAKPGETDPEKSKGYFRCPCHEGLFRADGSAFLGPPAEAKQVLERVPLKQVGNTLYLRYEEELS